MTLDPKNLPLESVAAVATEFASVALIVQGPTGLSVDHGAINAMYADIESTIASFQYDLATEKGRKNAASLAFGIAKKRTSIEADKKRLKEGLLIQGRAIDGAWNEIKEELEELQTVARAPLTAWEAEEAARQTQRETVLTMLTDAAIVSAAATSAELRERLQKIESFEIDRSLFIDLSQISFLRKTAVDVLTSTIAALNQAETDRAELARLREESSKREAADKEAVRLAEESRLAAEIKAQQEKAEAERIERARIAEEQRIALEAERIATAAKEAELKATREAEAQAKRIADELEAERQKEARRIAAEHQAELDRERTLRNEAEAKQKAEAARIQQEVQARQRETVRLKAEADKKAADDAKLAANKKHRSEVMMAAKLALMEHAKIDEVTAKRVVSAIVADLVPAVSVRLTS